MPDELAVMIQIRTDDDDPCPFREYDRPSVLCCYQRWPFSGHLREKVLQRKGDAALRIADLDVNRLLHVRHPCQNREAYFALVATRAPLRRLRVCSLNANVQSLG